MASLARLPCRTSMKRNLTVSSRRFLQNEAQSSRLASHLGGPRVNYESLVENTVYKISNAINRKSRITTDTIHSIVRDYKRVKDMTKALNAKRSLRAQNSTTMKRLAAEKNKEAMAPLVEEAKQLKVDITAMESELFPLEESLLARALLIPNDTHPDAPLGPESAARVVSTHGPEPLPASPLRDHLTIAQTLKFIDFESGANVVGASWGYLKQEVALLELALVNFSFAMAVKHGYTPVLTPDVVQADVARRCGFQPRDPKVKGAKPDMYHLDSSHTPGDAVHDLVLAATAEIPIAGMLGNRLFPEKRLPLKYVAFGHAFRPEAGARGADTRGLYRVHQFSKVELFSVTTAEASEALMEEMKALQISIFEALGLTFRVLDMPTEELGANAYRKYDIEAWMPGRGSWGEISSLSNCTDYQSRRLWLKYQHKEHQNLYAHTLNGTAAAIPRLIVALIENGAQFDENDCVTHINLPDVLKPYWLEANPGERDLIRWV
ncbi:seryl-tRNA synthetase [Cylindrobasidium torrendii FP15055 ss-10]|uniref:serine--tRNA ligase n=1 Tax=Cylindrobasidium torrendii FP15055 ss-10 TaxID=1314674 RepID=A0A0D7AXD5_9AGAR|nr:seryl-tRNA synthetase [Cylindrobasidium torrendii FP15055 ss-10]